MTPLYRHIPLIVSFLPSTLRTKTGGHSAMERSPWPKRLSGPHHAAEPPLPIGRWRAWRELGEESNEDLQELYYLDGLEEWGRAFSHLDGAVTGDEMNRGLMAYDG